MMSSERTIVAVGLVTALVVIGGVAYFVSTNKKPAITLRDKKISMLSKSNTKTIVDMVEQLQQLKLITNPKVAQVMLKVDRASFVPDKSLNPYKECAAPLGHNATISAPHMHAIGLDLLSEVIKPGSSVLDVGSGSGYMTACLAHLVGSIGRVYGIEHIPELVEQSLINIRKECPEVLDFISIKVGDGFDGFPSAAPYDAIYVGAAAEAIPQALVDQLRPGGRLVIPIGPAGGFHSLVVVDVKSDGSLLTKNLGPVRFVPLTTFDKQMVGDDHGMTKIVEGEDGKQILLRTQYFSAPDTTPQDIKIIKRNVASHNL